MKLYHGTNADNARNILWEGFKVEKGGQNWNCSGSLIYFWSPEALLVDGEVEDDGEGEYTANQNAFDNATCSLGRAKDCRAVIFEVELDESERVEPDESCQGMTGAVCVDKDIPPHKINKVWISADLSLLRGWFMAIMLNRSLATFQPTYLEEKIAKVMANIQIIDELEELADFTEYNPDQAKDILSS